MPRVTYPALAFTTFLSGSELIARHNQFDDQAKSFDRRAGFPAAAVETIAQAVFTRAVPKRDGVLLELGAGTGAVGAALAAMDSRYLGIDLSWPMLRVFRRRATDGEQPILAQADADRHWPVRVGTLRAVFLSRAVHHMDLDHLADEVERRASPVGTVVLLGAVERQPGGLRTALRREMRRRLETRGFIGVSGRRARRRLGEILVARGARAVPPQSVAQWHRLDTPREAIASWRRKPGLAGRMIDDEVKQHLLDRLETWAAEHFRGLDTAHETIERFLLETFVLKSSDRLENNDLNDQSLALERPNRNDTSTGARA